MKRILLVLLLALTLAALGAHWYLVRQVESSLDRLASQLAPIGQLSWDTVRVNRRGEARVERLALRLRDSRDPVRADLLRFDAGSPLALVGLSRDLSAMRLPDRLNLHIEGLSLPVNRELDELIGRQPLALPYASAGCAAFEAFSFYDLGELGQTELNADLKLSYQWVNQHEELDLTSRAYIRGMGDRRWRLRLALDGSDRSLSNLTALLTDSELLNFEQDYLDLGFYPRLLAFCADQTGLELNEQIDRHLQAWIDRWQRNGLQPGPLVIAGYRHFLHQPQMMSIRASDADGMGWGGGTQRPMQRVLMLMPATFSINEGTPVSLSFESVQPGLVTARPPEPETPPPEAAERDAETDPGFELGVATGWLGIEPGRAAAHIGQRARIQTRDGQSLSGRIAAVDDRFLHLTSRSRIGEFTRPIAIDEIESLQVRP